MNNNIFYRSIQLICICLLFTGKLLAQQDMFSTTYNDFIAGNQKIAVATTYIIVKQEVNWKLPLSTHARILRQLNDSVFIIKDEFGEIVAGLKLPANNNWKLSPGLLHKLKYGRNLFPLDLVVNSDTLDRAKTFFQGRSVIIPYTQSRVTKNISLHDFETILSDGYTSFISEYHKSPKEELQINNLDLSANRINLLHSNYPAYRGEGLVVSIKENEPDSADIDLKGRYLSNPIASSEVSPHATIMATMAAGAGNSYYLGRGVAQATGITSSSFANLFPDTDLQYRQFRVSVQNHSYGVGIENFYGADAAAFDESANRNDSLLFVFSAGNSGTQTSTSGNYSGLTGFANLTGSFKMAKNILTAGATDSFSVVAPQSSKGPAFDGRLKPELVAYGEDGSSGAAALISGTAILLQNAYKEMHGNTSPPSELIKGLLLNTCDDTDRPGIDFNSGYGALNANNAMKEMLRGNYILNSITGNSTSWFPLTIPSNIRRVKVLLTWKDPGATPNAFKAIINDLDLQVKSPDGLLTWLPWVLNSFPNKDSLMLLPVRKRDSLNTVEQVTIENPAAGNYTIAVSAANLATASQKFVLSVVFDTADYFEWNFPTAKDNIFPTTKSLLRWKSTYLDAIGYLEYSVDKGISWKMISSAVDLHQGFFRWNSPDTNTNALLRVTINSQQHRSDTFSISSKLNLRVGFNCYDSVLLFWNKVPGVDSYRLYGLADKFLQPYIDLRDTQYTIARNSLLFSHFAVASLLSGRPGIKSYAIDYSTQGVGCYVSNLTADLLNDTAAFLHLTIGTGFNVEQISFEKLISSKFTVIKIFQGIFSLDFTFNDLHLSQGENTYRAAIHLKDGRIVYSNPTTVIYLSTFKFIAYPNPLQSHRNITIQFKELHNQIIQLMDASGQVLMSLKADNTMFRQRLDYRAGIYFLRIADPSRLTSKTIKIIIL